MLMGRRKAPFGNLETEKAVPRTKGGLFNWRGVSMYSG